jgi:hypothetical protein
LSSESAVIATGSGVVRKAAGRDAGLLDLAKLKGARIAVADVDRDEFRAGLLAASLSESDWARANDTVFEAVAVRAVEQGYECDTAARCCSCATSAT